MNEKLLVKHIDEYLNSLNSLTSSNDVIERNERKNYYQSFDSEKLIKMSLEEFYNYISKLWAMLIWGNKKYKINQLILDNATGEFKHAC